jgi:hypothetical protein
VELERQSHLMFQGFLFLLRPSTFSGAAHMPVDLPLQTLCDWPPLFLTMMQIHARHCIQSGRKDAT